MKMVGNKNISKGRTQNMINLLKKVESKSFAEPDPIEEEKPEQLKGTKWKRKYIKLIEAGEKSDFTKSQIENYEDEEVGPDNFNVVAKLG